jgi:hypothetical protein
MPLTAGARLGSYEILSPLGRGGMGEVYLARDNDLGRDVAVKVLPEEVASDPDRLARFEREAHVLATLNHPNIAAIYGVERVDDTRALVLEFVDGPTLADRIIVGAIPLDETIALARQIAEALETAHSQGVVHRDLKPSNIAVRRDGVVKVLDFGLAKLIAPPEIDRDSTRPHGLSQSPTITSPALLTSAGVVLGTAAYMSPEQAKGQPADKRSDIWAFGCVLYEMLTGRRPFDGGDVTETMAFVLTRDPDWSALPAEVPGPLRTLLARCLERDRRRRVGDIAAARFVLDELSNLAGAARHEDRETASRRHLGPWAITAVALAIAAAAVLYRPQPAAPPPKAFTYSILPPDGHTFLATSLAGAPSLSPDGRQIAYVASGPTGRQVWVQSLDALDARPIAGTEGAACPFWSADGAWLGFLARGSLNRVNVAGGQAQVLASRAPFGRVCFGGSVNERGTIVYAGGGDNTLATVSAAGGESVQLTQRNISLFDENHMAPHFLPDGQRYLLQVRGGPDLQFQVWIGQLGSNERRLLLKDVTNARYAPPVALSGPGHLVYVRGRTLVAHPFDPATLALAGPPITIAQGIAVGGGGAAGDFDVSPTGVLVYRRGEPGSNDLGWYDRAGQTAGTIGDREGNPRNNVRISPDGKWAAFTRMGETTQDVWLADLTSGAISRFTLDGGRSPVWSPDGSHLAYLRDDTIYRKPFTGSGPEVAVWSGAGTLAITDWSGDGKYLLLTRWETSKPALTGRGVWLLSNPLDDAAPHEATLFEARALHAVFGPRIEEPRWVAYDAGQVFIKTMPGRPPGTWQVSVNGGSNPRWRADGRELFFLSGGSVVSAAFDDTSSMRARARQPLFMTPSAFSTAAGQYAPGWDVAPDGSRFLTTLPALDTPPSAITVMMNWQAGLR